MNLVETLGLFEETRQDSWRGWRSIAARIDGHAPEDPAFLERVTQRSDLTKPKKVFAICGRGAGKSRFGAMAACASATSAYKRVVGENIYVGIFAPDRRQATVSFRYVEGLLSSNQATASLITDQTQSSVTLANGVIVEVLTADFRAVRSRAYALAIVEEAAFLPTDNSATPDTELLRALRPALARVPGSMLVVLSSPYARRGELYKAHRQHFGKAGDTLVVEASTLDLNPTFDRSEIEDAFEDDPAAAASEYGALDPQAQPRIAFRSDVETFISREAIDACVVAGRLELPQVPKVAYVGFADPSGGSSDAFTVAVAHAERRGDQTVSVLDLVREWRPPFSPERVVEELSGVVKSYGLTWVTGDRYGAEFTRELFRKHAITYRPSEKDRSAIYLELLPAINSGRIELLDNPRLLAQLASLERKSGRTGRDTVDHGPGQHDDLCNSAAGALTLASVEGQAVDLAGLVAAGISVESQGGSRWDFGRQDPAGIVSDLPLAGGWKPRSVRDAERSGGKWSF